MKKLLTFALYFFIIYNIAFFNSISPIASANVLTCATGGTCAVGDTGPGGGKIFYDAGSDKSWGRYLEAACAGWRNNCDGTTSDLTARWGCYGNPITGAQYTAIGTGEQNTAAILAECTTAGIAAKVANDLWLGGQSDWFLPSKDELDQMYIRRAIIGFSTGSYWSSSENGGNYAFYMYSTTGTSLQREKNYIYYFRPVRAFSIITIIPPTTTVPPTTTTTTSTTTPTTTTRPTTTTTTTRPPTTTTLPPTTLPPTTTTLPPTTVPPISTCPPETDFLYIWHIWGEVTNYGGKYDSGNYGTTDYIRRCTVGPIQSVLIRTNYGTTSQTSRNFDIYFPKETSNCWEIARISQYGQSPWSNKVCYTAPIPTTTTRPPTTQPPTTTTRPPTTQPPTTTTRPPTTQPPTTTSPLLKWIIVTKREFKVVDSNIKTSAICQDNTLSFNTTIFACLFNKGVRTWIYLPPTKIYFNVKYRCYLNNTTKRYTKNCTKL